MWGGSMSVYSKIEDPFCADVDRTLCNGCGFDCDIYGYCKKNDIDDVDLQDYYLYDVLKQKGYGGCNLKVETIHGKSWLILYPYRGAYLIAEKCNVELACPVVPLKTRYTMNVPGLNVSNCYGQLLQVIDQLTPFDQPVDSCKIISVDDMYEYVKREYPVSFQHCKELNIIVKPEVVNLISALNNLGLQYVSINGEITGYIPLEELEL